MPWIKFTGDHLWRVPALKGHVAVAFKKGLTIFATRDAADISIAKGVAREATPEEIADARK